MAATTTLADLDWVGFDLDHTLMRYHVSAVMELVYTGLMRYLGGKYGLQVAAAPYDPGFAVKGLCCDTRRGNLLVLGADGGISRATHGTRPLTSAEVSVTYAADEVQQLIELLTEGRKHAEYVFLTTYFDAPGGLVLARLVDHVDVQSGERCATRYTEAMQDVFAAFEHNLHSDNFSQGTGYYFPEVIEHPEKYLMKCSEALKQWIKCLHQNHTRVFLLTNSHADYTKHLLDYGWGSSWERHFDLIIVKGQKPSFFAYSSADCPFYDLHVDGYRAGAPAEQLAMGQLFVHGNRECLGRFLHEHAAFSRGGRELRDPFSVDATNPAVPALFPTVEGARPAVEISMPSGGPRVAYFGDHLSGDILAVRRHTNWHPIAIAEELLLHSASFPLVESADDMVRQYLQKTHAQWPAWNTSLHHRLLVDNSSLVIPHLDAIAGRPLASVELRS